MQGKSQKTSLFVPRLPRRGPRRSQSQSGMTLIETVIALAVLLIVAGGLLGIGVVSTTTTENQGHQAARATEYAQDKMEQLIALAYGDGDTPTAGVGTDTTVFPACNPLISPPPTCTTGSGLFPGGFANPSFPQNKYVDWLDVNGNLLGGGPSTTVPPGYRASRSGSLPAARRDTGSQSSPS